MNRLFLGAALLASSLVGSAAQAAPSYTATTQIVSPANKASYTAYYPLPAKVTFSITNQLASVSGAAPSTYISFGWSMIDYDTNTNYYFANDYTISNVSVMTDKSGHYSYGVNGSFTGSNSQMRDEYSTSGTAGFISSTTVYDTQQHPAFTATQFANYTVYGAI